MLKALVIQNTESEGLGIVSKNLRQKGISADFIKTFKYGLIPKHIDGYDGLVVLGGPMGVYEDDLYPFIRQEISLLKDAVKKNIPVLGICLGAQLLAKAAGADVYKGTKKEIGWYEITLNEQGKRDMLFIGLPDKFTVFQWHGDTFDFGKDLNPVAGTFLASSELFQNQIIKVGKNAYGLQFHLEVTEEMIRNWINVNDRELNFVKDYINPETILRDTSRHIDTIHRYGDVVFSRFLNLLQRR